MGETLKRILVLCLEVPAKKELGIFFSQFLVYFSLLPAFKASKCRDNLNYYLSTF